MSADGKYWFPAKHHGWGWGPPTRWQGWAVIVAFAGLILTGAIVLLPNRGPTTFILYSVLLCVVLVAVCWLKGEPPRWRSGSE